MVSDVDKANRSRDGVGGDKHKGGRECFSWWRSEKMKEKAFAKNPEKWRTVLKKLVTPSTQTRSQGQRRWSIGLWIRRQRWPSERRSQSYGVVAIELSNLKKKNQKNAKERRGGAKGSNAGETEEGVTVAEGVVGDGRWKVVGMVVVGIAGEVRVSDGRERAEKG